MQRSLVQTVLAAALTLASGTMASAQAPTFPSPNLQVWAGRNMTFSNFSLNGGGNVAHVVAGSTVTVASNWAYTVGSGDIYCPGCIVQWYFGITNVYTNCFFSGGLGGGSGSGNTSGSFAAPTSPGIYFVQDTISLDFSCQSRTFGNVEAEAIGALVVWPDVAKPTLVDIATEPAGSNCPNGGQKITVGSGVNNSGAISSVDLKVGYACNGASGVSGLDGTNAVISVSDEPADTNCAAGGQRLEVGIDLNENGLLDDGNSTTKYVCNGAPGTSSVIQVSDEPAGNHCAAGGNKIEAGLDLNGNGLPDDGNSTVAYVCNGVDGDDADAGADGAGALVKVTTEDAGPNCAAGGQRIDTGIDTNGNSQLDDGNVVTAYVCNGAAGMHGHDGPQGAPGTNGTNGADGLDGVEAVDGADGRNGVDGQDGVDGRDGQDGAVGAEGTPGIDGAGGGCSVGGATGGAGLFWMVTFGLWLARRKPHRQ